MGKTGCTKTERGSRITCDHRAPMCYKALQIWHYNQAPRIKIVSFQDNTQRESTQKKAATRVWQDGGASSSVGVLRLPHLEPKALVGIQREMRLGPDLFFPLSARRELPGCRWERFGRLRIRCERDAVEGLQQANQHERSFVVRKLENIAMRLGRAQRERARVPVVQDRCGAL